MKEKSKFITFLLSFIPGLSHLYLGFVDRAVIFLMVFFGTIGITLGLAYITYSDAFLAILILALPIIWLVALLDAFSLRKSLRSNGYINNENEVQLKSNNEIKNSNRKLITLALSTIPGAGHMYLGLQNKGLVLMAVFFFTVFFMGWLSSSLFLFVLPLIWFYSFFDALHIVNGTKTDGVDFLTVFPKIKPEWIGWGLIGIGILVVVERIIYPLIPYQLRNYIQTSIVSIIFILGGIKLLIKGRANDNQEEGDDLCKEDE
ncbi:hypothetical protein [Tepidimicrobium xylanilyticum]|uniref:TM2 domain-containing protein n=1 Tax=Tepidimicrobium xylanilyticum TaxID=1123352 RepID=A0A1H3E6C6_9FIRM|nr:hypothetical protein [Tepidimicrobium xylanilyticum]GMG95821.1 hypothetical protein EN5CB1_06470 [Tepidimicrobium xylanilyticum]SDX74303.1 hypothetical protein SAMN05660923_02843 [Tepidimicrobium xylanilyticum]